MPSNNNNDSFGQAKSSVAKRISRREGFQKLTGGLENLNRKQDAFNKTVADHIVRSQKAEQAAKTERAHIMTGVGSATATVASLKEETKELKEQIKVLTELISEKCSNTKERVETKKALEKKLAETLKKLVEAEADAEAQVLVLKAEAEAQRLALKAEAEAQRLALEAQIIEAEEALEKEKDAYETLLAAEREANKAKSVENKKKLDEAYAKVAILHQQLVGVNLTDIMYEEDVDDDALEAKLNLAASLAEDEDANKEEDAAAADVPTATINTTTTTVDTKVDNVKSTKEEDGNVPPGSTPTTATSASTASSFTFDGDAAAVAASASAPSDGAAETESEAKAMGFAMLNSRLGGLGQRLGRFGRKP